MDMRKLILLILIAACQIAMAIDINKRTISALDYINNGHVQYGFEELKKTSVVNDLAAQFYVAVCYENGIGVEKDFEQAFKMYRKAAERGLPDAMWHLASFYRNGIIVPQNSSRENEWMQRYNQKGGKMTLPDLLSIYNEGLNHPENYALNPNGSNIASKNQVAQIPTPVAKQPQAPINIEKTQPINKPVVRQIKADVDLNIPLGNLKRENTFALIIANENYQEEEIVPNALNDGAVFAEYCEKTLGIPSNNIKYVADATLNVIRRQVNWLCQVMDAYQGQANIIFYYAGHGIPDESNMSSYILPVDGYGTDVSSGYGLDKLYSELSSKPAKSVIVLLDACFSGAKRDGGMLASARGVAIKVKQNKPKGNMIIMSAAQGDETAYPYEEKMHGMFTYYLLKKLQETKGDVTLGELADYVTTEVKKRSIIINGKMQTPSIKVASELDNNWKILKMD